MQVKNVVPIVVSVLLGAVAVALVSRYMGTEERMEATKEYYLVAAQNLKVGDVLSQETVTARKVAVRDASRMAIDVPTPSSAVKVYGQKVMRDIEKDDFILYTDVGVLRVSPLAEAVEAGKWAVTIGVDNIGGLAGLVRPGDEVALIATLAVPQQTPQSDLTAAGGAAGVRMAPATFVLYPVVKVLAIGQQVAGEVSPFGKDVKGGGEVTLVVTPRQALEIAHVRQFGRLSLAMRCAGDKSATEPATFGGVTDKSILDALLSRAKQ